MTDRSTVDQAKTAAKDVARKSAEEVKGTASQEASRVSDQSNR